MGCIEIDCESWPILVFPRSRFSRSARLTDESLFLLFTISLFLDITIKNYLVEPVAVNLSNFSLVDKSGKTHTMDKKMMKDVFTDRCLRNIKLDVNKSYADGLLIFSVGQNSKIDYLAYNIDGQKVTKKYFP